MADAGSRVSVQPLEGASMAATLSELHGRQFLPLVRLARTLVDHEASAEEVVQEAFEGLIRRWSGLRDAQALEAYLRRAVINGCHDRLRRRAVRRAFESSESRTALSAEDAAVLSEEQQRLLKAVRGLPPRQRDVLLLRYFAEWSEAEIADALNISKGTVKSSAHKGLTALRASLTEGMLTE